MICVYDGRDAERSGHGLGVIHPSECTITEETGGSYELSATLPLMSEWLLMTRGNVIRAPGAPHRMSEQMQDFRIYGVELADDGRAIRVQARHVFYDAATAFVLQAVEFDGAAVSAVLDAMAANSDGTPYALDVQTGDATYTGSIDLVNWVNALLDPDAGIVSQAHLRLERDRMTVRLRPEGGVESGLTVRWGSNMTGLTRSEKTDQVVTRLRPAGEDAEGNAVYLPEVYIDSPRIGEYWQPLENVWRVSGAKVGQKTRDADGNTVELTLEDVYDMLRKAAQERLQSGCDLPDEKTSLAYVDMSRIAPDDAVWAATNVCLYDWLTIVHGAADIQESVQVTGYAWDVLRQRYATLEVGDAFRDRTDNVFVTAPQLRKDMATAGKRSLRVEDLIDITAEEISMQARRIELIAYDFEDLDLRTSQAEIRLDGMDGQITALGTDVSEQGDVISQVVLDLNAAEADILLKAERTEVEDLGVRVSSAEIGLDAMKAEVALRARKDDVEAEFKVQYDLISANAAAIALKADQASLDMANGRIDAQADEIALKADKIDLQGYVSITDLDVVRADVDNLTSGVTTASLLRTAGLICNNSMNYLGEIVGLRHVTMGGISSTGRALSTGGELDLQHSHAVTVDADGTVTLGEVSAEGGNFKIADTKVYKDGVSAAYGNGYNEGFASGKESYLPTVISRTGYSTADKTVTVRAANSHQDLLTGQVIDASEIYDAGYSSGKAEGGADAVTLSKSWSGGILTVKASNGKSSTAQLAKGTESWSGNTVSVPVLDGSGSTGYSISVDASARYNAGYSAGNGAGYNTGYAAGKDAYAPTVITRTGYSVANKNVTVKASNSHQDLLTGKTVDATEIYNGGWNACIDACNGTTALYRITQDISTTTLYYSNGTAAGTGFVRVARVYNTYFIPEKI